MKQLLFALLTSLLFTLACGGGDNRPVYVTVIDDAGTPQNQPASDVQFILPATYRIGAGGPEQPYTNVIPLDAGYSAFVPVPAGAAFVLVTINPQTDTIFPRVDQSGPHGVQTTYDPRPMGWMPLWPEVDTLILNNPATTGTYLPFAVLFANEWPEQ